MAGCKFPHLLALYAAAKRWKRSTQVLSTYLLAHNELLKRAGARLMRKASALWKLRTSASFMRRFLRATRTAGLQETERHVPPINSARTDRQRAVFSDRTPSGELTGTEMSSTSVGYPRQRVTVFVPRLRSRPSLPCASTPGDGVRLLRYITRRKP